MADKLYLVSVVENPKSAKGYRPHIYLGVYQVYATPPTRQFHITLVAVTAMKETHTMYLTLSYSLENVRLTRG